MEWFYFIINGNMVIIIGNGLSVREIYEGMVFKGEEYIEGDGEDEMVVDG